LWNFANSLNSFNKSTIIGVVIIRRILMTPEEAERLANLLRTKRRQLGFTAREVARRASVDVGTVTRIEAAQILSPRPDNLTAIGQVLGIPAADIFAITDWLPRKELPTFQPYMRAKYKELPDEAVAKIEAYFAELAGEYGLQGPTEGEDER
jgi:transcriptional regulator with XRE-family HTH domain